MSFKPYSSVLPVTPARCLALLLLILATRCATAQSPGAAPFDDVPLPDLPPGMLDNDFPPPPDFDPFGPPPRRMRPVPPPVPVAPPRAVQPAPRVPAPRPEQPPVISPPPVTPVKPPPARRRPRPSFQWPKFDLPKFKRPSFDWARFKRPAFKTRKSRKTPPVEFDVGTRFLYVNLLNDRKGKPFDNSFVGSITRIEADQDLLGFRPFAQATTQRGRMRFGLGISMDALTIDTRDSGGGDGAVEMDSWMFYAYASYLTRSRFSPFAELGIARYDNSFDPKPEWSAGGLRRFVLDDSSSVYLAAGCTYEITEHWHVEFYLRRVDVDVDGQFILATKPDRPEALTFTMEHIAYGLGGTYRF